MNVWKHAVICGVTAVLQAALAPPAVAAGQAASRSSTEPVIANDNTRPAGTLVDGVVTIRLRASAGTWRPEGESGPALTVEAFGTLDAPLSVPAPLIRVQEGDRVAVSIRNELPSPLRVHGLCARDGSPCAPIDVEAGATRGVTFVTGAAGTYHYWATAIGAPMPFRELAGALVVDPRDSEPPRDRILVITEWSNLTGAQLREIMASDNSTATFMSMRPQVAFVINGLSWPATERLTYRRGERVRWRVINLTSQTHPMHLHGFYFTIQRIGDGNRDEPVAGGTGRQVVTHIMPSGATLLMEWTPEREGNWLFHCHVMTHVSPNRRISADPSPAGHHAAHGAGHGDAGHDPGLGMAGMVLGITVLPQPGPVAGAPKADRAPRKLTMVIQPTGDGAHASAGFRVTEHDAAPNHAAAATPSASPESGTTTASSPGPLVLLRRGEPIEITVVNRLADATSIHWHGLELDSYYDGVHGWSGAGQRLAPMIAPGASFVVRITPVRAGTFIYHTHLHDHRQLSSGVYGPLLVLDAGETYDPATDHVVVLGRSHVTEASSILEEPGTSVINGSIAPLLSWRAGTRNRVRILNITPDDILDVSLVTGGVPVSWKPLTKDGTPVPEAESKPSPARVRIAVGETYDFEYDARAARHTLWLEVRTSGGKWMSQARVVVK